MTKTANTNLDEARAWVARQLRFEHFLGSLERQVAIQLDEVRRS